MLLEGRFNHHSCFVDKELMLSKGTITTSSLALPPENEESTQGGENLIVQ